MGREQALGEGPGQLAQLELCEPGGGHVELSNCHLIIVRPRMMGTHEMLMKVAARNRVHCIFQEGGPASCNQP